MRTLISAMILTLATPVFALEDAVRRACTGDYFQFCAHTTPGSARCTACFNDVGPGLSPRCLDAIRQSSEFGDRYNTRRRNLAQGSR